MQAHLRARLSSTAGALQSLEHALLHHARLVDAAAAAEAAQQRASILQAAQAVLQGGLQTVLTCQGRLLTAMRQPATSAGLPRDTQALWSVMLGSPGSPAVLPCGVEQTLTSIQQASAPCAQEKHS